MTLNVVVFDGTKWAVVAGSHPNFPTSGALYPSDTLFPSNTLLPGG